MGEGWRGMATFILVHGTYVKQANWPLLHNGLGEVAAFLKKPAQFEQVDWRGRNHTSAGEKAANKILKLVQTTKANRPNEKVFLIGHSHGGSAIAYLLKAHPEAAAHTSGSAFLSTPFVAIRPRQNASRQLAMVGLFLFIFTLVGSVALLAALHLEQLLLFALGVIAFAYSAFV